MSLVCRQLKSAKFPFVMLFALLILCSPSAQSQTFTVLHTFTGGADGAAPYGSLTLDRAGNLYGTASAGGFKGNDCPSAGCGTVFKLTHAGSSWILTALYSFQGDPDAAVPYAGVTIGPNGSLYGTTLMGGGHGYGAVFNLRPPAHFSANVNGGWSDTVLHGFQGNDGVWPVYGNVIFDPAGNLYGTTSDGGYECTDGGYCGTVFKLTPSAGGWTLSSFFFMGGSGGGNPYSGVIRDASGNLYGTTNNYSANSVVYRLTPSGSGWTETTLYNFAWPEDPQGGVILDPAGNLFGTTLDSAYELMPSGGQWTYSLLHSFPGNNEPFSGMVRDASGNLYGTTCGDNVVTFGSVFKLTPTQGSWTETDLYDFTGGGNGSCPAGGVALDASGNLYGTTLWGGGPGCGVPGCGLVWELTP
jgi:uncharacterized repeat protein (TIGR03803 family)